MAGFFATITISGIDGCPVVRGHPNNDHYYGSNGIVSIVQGDAALIMVNVTPEQLEAIASGLLAEARHMRGDVPAADDVVNAVAAE